MFLQVVEGPTTWESVLETEFEVVGPPTSSNIGLKMFLQLVAGPTSWQFMLEVVSQLVGSSTRSRDVLDSRSCEEFAAGDRGTAPVPVRRSTRAECSREEV